MHQAWVGFLSYHGQRRMKAKEERFSFRKQLASFLRFMAANSFTQLDTRLKPLYCERMRVFPRLRQFAQMSGALLYAW